mgnify:CR=1 FL=1
MDYVFTGFRWLETIRKLRELGAEGWALTFKIPQYYYRTAETASNNNGNISCRALPPSEAPVYFPMRTTTSSWLGMIVVDWPPAARIENEGGMPSVHLMKMLNYQTVAVNLKQRPQFLPTL